MRASTLRLAMCLAMCLVVLCGSAYGANPDYILQVANPTVAGSTYRFDIYISQKGSEPFYLAQCGFALQFNAANFTSPTVTLQTPGLTADYTVMVAKTGTNTLMVDVLAPYVDSAPDFAAKILHVSAVPPGTFVGTFAIAGISNPAGTIGLQWIDSGLLPTLVSAYNSTTYDMAAITNPLNHLPPDNTSLPVTMVAFTADADLSRGGVVVQWKTVSEVSNYGFTVQRGVEGQQGFADLPNAFVPGFGTSATEHAYSYIDKTVPGAGTYSYRLRQQDLDGTIHYTNSIAVSVSVTDVAEVVPRLFQLLQNYPNPFNPSTQVKFSVETTAHATLKAYNALGEEVATLFEGTAEAGRYYIVPFDASHLATGLYFYRLTTDNRTDIRRMLLLR